MSTTPNKPHFPFETIHIRPLKFENLDQAQSTRIRPQVLRNINSVFHEYDLTPRSHDSPSASPLLSISDAQRAFAHLQSQLGALDMFKDLQIKLIPHENGSLGARATRYSPDRK